MPSANHFVDGPGSIRKEHLTLAEGKLAECAEGKDLALILVRAAIIGLHVRPSGGDEDAGSVGPGSEGATGIIQRMRPGIGRGVLDAVVHLAVHIHLKRIVVGCAVVEAAIDRAEIDTVRVVIQNGVRSGVEFLAVDVEPCGQMLG